MKFVDEYRDGPSAQALSRAIAAMSTKPVRIMEVCGGQTHAIVRFGIDQLLPETVELIHGPGCPVCVTPPERIDLAVELAARPGTIVCSFGDMLRVPGTGDDLLHAKAAGGDVRIVYSPLDAVTLAERHPEFEVVFFAVGFETTAPANAMAVLRAEELGLTNFSMVVSQVLVPPAMEAILANPDTRVQAFLAAGHVCTIMGCAEYEPLARKYRVPIVVTGFEPLDILQGVAMCVRQFEEGRAVVENQYARAVRSSGNEHARAAILRVFEVSDRRWRGIGAIPASGLEFRSEYARFDAIQRFGMTEHVPESVGECISGLVLQGIRKPDTCPAFGSSCTPERPLGAPMVSTEGACAAYYRYRPTPMQEVTT